MKKRLFALFCAVLLLAGLTPAALALTGEETRAADTLYTLGIVKGTGGSYELNRPVTRAEAAVILVRLSGGEAAAAKSTYRSIFTDLPSWAAADIAYAQQQGWVSGTTGNTYGSSESLSANAFCAFLLRMLGYSESSGDFTYTGAATFAQHIGLVSGSLSGTLTRGQLFSAVAGALTFSYQDGSDTVISRLIENGNVSFAAAGALGLLDPELTARQIADRCTAAVFCLRNYDTQDEIDEETPSSNASGFFISSDGIAVTNYHSIKGSIYTVATLSTGEEYPVEKVLYYDANIDIAVIRISRTSLKGAKASSFAYLDTATSDTLRNGDVVCTIGNPLGLGLAISSGIISSVGRSVDGYKLPCILNTADISQGNSGGALLNAYGQVVGVTTGAFIYGNNMYLAVPVDPALTADLTGPGETLAQVAAKQAVQDATDAANAANAAS